MTKRKCNKIMNNWTGETRPSSSNLNMFIENLKPFEVQQKFLRERKCVIYSS